MSLTVDFELPFRERGYAMLARMSDNVSKSNAAILIFKDAQVFIQRECANPSRPIVVELEGNEPSSEQLEMLQIVYLQLSTEFPINVMALCDRLLPFHDKLRHGE